MSDASPHSTPQGARQIRDALTAMRDQGDRPGFYEEASDALVALDNLVEQLDAARGALEAIAEGGLGDKPWLANYDRIREFAREALNPATEPSSPSRLTELLAEATETLAWAENAWPEDSDTWSSANKRIRATLTRLQKARE